MDGVEFEELLQQAGAGNSTAELDYRRFDESPKMGYNYYRLKQTDYDGRNERFNIEVVYFSGSTISDEDGSGAKVYPNPSKGEEVYLELAKLESGKCIIEILNPFGQTISQREWNIDETQENFKLELLRGKELAAGTYYVRILNESSQEILPMIIKR